MNLRDLGDIMITATIQPAGRLMDVTVECSNRVEVVKATTQPEENPEQFGKRIASILRGIYSTPKPEAPVESTTFLGKLTGKGNG